MLERKDFMLIILFFNFPLLSSSDNSKLEIESLKGKKHTSKFINEKSIFLERGKGTKVHGGGIGGYYWNIYFFAKDDLKKRAGKAYINLINEEPLGEHPSLQVFLNKTSQGMHIGRYVFRKACEESDYDEVYAHIRKGNLPSIKAAKAAGFKEYPLSQKSGQLILKWTRNLLKKIK